jgi:8-oxo-dGTP pyrophosphatase MutT (NUDIX family)
MHSSIYLSEKPEELCSFVESKLKNHKYKTYKYANVPYRKAAVLIPLFYKNDTIHILFTKRTEKVEHHKGQISFPGGMKDKSDKNLRNTALRETWEEMGIAEENITLLGRIDNFLTNTNFMITPYVGYFPFPYDYKINEDEISKVIEVPLAELLKSDCFEIKKWYRNGILWDVHYYYCNNETIWGVTGFLLSNFLSIVFGLKKELFKS